MNCRNLQLAECAGVSSRPVRSAVPLSQRFDSLRSERMAATSRPALMTAAARIAERLPALSGRVVELIVAHEAAYQSGGTVPHTVLVGSVEANMRRILEALAGVAGPEQDELAVAWTTGRRRAQQGVPLEAVLRAYRLATQIVLHAMVTELRGDLRHGSEPRDLDELEVFLDATAAVTEVVDRHSQAVVDGYRRTEAELRHRDAQRRQAVFDALLEGRGADPRAAAEALSALGLPATGGFAVVVAAFDVAAQHTFSAARDALATYSFTAAWRTRGDREIGLVSLAGGPLSRLLDTLRRTPLGRVGVSDAFEHVRDLPEAHRWAELAARTVETNRSEVAWIAERLPEALLRTSPALAERLARDTFGPLLDLPPEESALLLRTLAVWLEHGRSAARSAAVLYCHRNTVVNRLHRIEGLSGGSLEDERFLLHCHLGLLTLRPMPSASAPVEGGRSTEATHRERQPGKP